jgi:hypothetical protein
MSGANPGSARMQNTTTNQLRKLAVLAELRTASQVAATMTMP